MKAIIVNGGPRKNGNTAKLLARAQAGAAAAGAETESVHLYDLDYRGCVSCFECKRLGGKSFGRCAMRDGLTPLLDRIREADALIVGTPLYLMTETAMTRAFFERLVFQYISYTNPPGTHCPRPVRTGVIYTMNITEEGVETYNLPQSLDQTTRFLGVALGSCERMLCTDTLQFDDYSKYESALFDSAAKQKRNREAFPQDEQRAYELGKRLGSPE